LRLNFGLASIFTAAVGLMVKQLKVGLFSAYLSVVVVVVVVGQPKHRTPPETHFP